MFSRKFCALKVGRQTNNVWLMLMWKSGRSKSGGQTRRKVRKLQHFSYWSLQTFTGEGRRRIEEPRSSEASPLILKANPRRSEQKYRELTDQGTISGRKNTARTIASRARSFQRGLDCNESRGRLLTPTRISVTWLVSTHRHSAQDAREVELSLA